MTQSTNGPDGVASGIARATDRSESVAARRRLAAKFVVLYAAIYGAYGVASPFLPAFLGSRGVSAEMLGFVLAAGTAIRLVAAPLAGRIGDRLRALRVVLVFAAAAACVITASYFWANGSFILALIYLCQSAALAPTGMLADALAVGRGFEYGWVRGAGSAAFIVGTLAAGQAVAAFGLSVIVLLQAGLLGAEALAANRVPERPHPTAPRRGMRAAMKVLFRIAPFRGLVLAAALVLGSHAMHDAFAMIRWRAAGIDAGTASLLWSEAVAAEVLVFFFAGPALVARLGPGGAIALAALAGAVRWGVMATSGSVLAAALAQPLHGLTFALLHLACMRLIARIVPSGLEGTAQAIYGTLGIGAASAVLTLAAGLLYGRFGPPAFWAMAALCAAALPVGLKLRTS
jgi:PPP family 3-phenylpropionic acid transporter